MRRGKRKKRDYASPSFLLFLSSGSLKRGFDSLSLRFRDSVFLVISSILVSAALSQVNLDITGALPRGRDSTSKGSASNHATSFLFTLYVPHTIQRVVAFQCSLIAEVINTRSSSETRQLLISTSFAV